MKKLSVIGVIFVAFAIATAFFIYQQKKVAPVITTSNNQDLILYYGDTCPHCKIVEAFLQDNKISEKVDFSQKEAFFNSKNSKELIQKATQCKINPNEIGVPLLWNNGQCLVGDEDIINFFKDKAGIK